MNNNIFSFDEKKEAEDILKTGFENQKIDSRKMYVIAKYLKETLNYGETRLKKELIDFCKKQDPTFNPILEEEKINKWIYSASNFYLRKISGVIITEEEVNFLKTIENIKDRKILFAILVMSKALKEKNTFRKKKNINRSPFYYIHYENFQTIISVLDFKITETELALVLNKNQKLFFFYYPEKELIRIEYEKKGEPKIIIKEFENLMTYFYLIFGKTGNISHCSICGKEIIKKNNKQQRCTECSKIIRNQKQKELMRKKRAIVSI